jgi:phenylalanyl-tRNA synthetase beta chain
MKFSHNWLQTFFADKLPTAEVLAEKITFHSSEIEEVISLPKDSVLDVKVLPDKSAWLMSHRGLAKEISVMLDLPLKKDPFKQKSTELSQTEKVSITLSSDVCDYYGAALIEGVKVGPSPDWLKEKLEAVGQRSINNIVDATNYVMFELGQPLHAFDAGKLEIKDGHYCVGVRQAKSKESIVTLTGETYELSTQDTIIIDGNSDQPIGIAGVKGGKYAAVENTTSTILLESAHFNRVAIRNTAKRLKLQTDASKRFENGICVAVAPIALGSVVEIILKVASGQCLSQASSGRAEVVRKPVSCLLGKINSVLGLSLNKKDVSAIIDKFGYEYSWEEEVLSIIPSFERDDILIAEDLIEEIGRMHGLNHVVSIAPTSQVVSEFNKRHYYAEKIRAALIELGFSEIYTSSFRNKDIVKLENALASDKEYLRSTLTSNLNEAKDRNISHRDLLGLLAIKLFEIGTVFGESTEEFRVGLVVQTGNTFKAKIDDVLLDEALVAIAATLGLTPDLITKSEGVVEFSLDALLPKLAAPIAYENVEKSPVIKYQPFSVYPAMVRDVAMWVDGSVDIETVTSLIKEAAGSLLKRITLFDEFSKEGRTSYAFRLVFQSSEKTLTDSEVETYMDCVYKTVANQGWEGR